MKTKNVVTSSLLLAASLVAGLTACQSKGESRASEGDSTAVERVAPAVRDTNLLRVALVPDYDCLPIYYAKRSGIYQRLGLQVEIATYRSQLDCDTALLGKTVDGGMADSERLTAMGRRAADLQTMWKGNRRWTFVVRDGLRAKEVNALRGRTLASARQSVEERLMDAFLEAGRLSKESVYRPQIHDFRLRAAMLGDKQYDGAFLPWPYASLACQQGAKLWKGSLPAAAPTCFVMKRSRLDIAKVAQQWALLEKGRRMAIDSLRVKGPAVYSQLLQQTYQLPRELADTLRYR